MSPYEQDGKTYLQGKAYLKVSVDLPPALLLTPTAFLEMAGNSILKGVLSRIKQRLLGHLLQDYRHWASQNQLDENQSQKQLNPTFSSLI